MHFPHTSFTLLLLSSATLALAQTPEVKPKDLPQQAAANLPRAQVSEIHTRIEELRARQAEYHKKVASGAIAPNADVLKEWPNIQKQVIELHGLITELNTLDAESPALPALQDKLFLALQQVGTYLDSASHPEFKPRTLDAVQLAEMQRIEKAIASMKFGERKSATPVKLLTPAPCFTLIYLPVPIVLQCRPNDTVYLAAITAGAFHNGLSLIELQADAQGIAKTTWLSIGDAVADCDITIYSQAAIETQNIRIKVVSPSLPPIENLPTPEQLKGEIPRLQSKFTIIKGQVDQIIK